MEKIEIINSREKDDIVEVLKLFTDVETVTRDFSLTYKNAITEALPNAKQIVDRFHIIKNLTDDEATILMVDTNLNQRQEILPSEKAFAYKMKLEAMRHQGKRVDLLEDETSDPMGWKLESANKLGKEVGESMTNIRRYIRLTHLIPELLEQVDLKRIAFRPAVELSYLSEDNQYVVQNIFEFDEVTPSLSQAIRLKKLEQEGKLTEEKIEEILGQEKPNQKEFIKIHNERIDKYIPQKIKESGKVEDFIIQCVEEHNKREKLRQERSAR